MQRSLSARSSAKWMPATLLLGLMSGLASGCAGTVSPPDPTGGAGMFGAGGSTAGSAGSTAGSGGLGSVEDGSGIVGTRDAQPDASGPMDDASLGFACGVQLRCVPAERCVTCERALLTYELLCVPDPDRDPNGYAEQTRDCMSVRVFRDCDGPEDCASGEFCIVNMADAIGARCDSQPVLNPCWSCNAVRGTFCHVDEHCPVGTHCGDVGYGQDIRGCQ